MKKQIISQLELNLKLIKLLFPRMKQMGRRLLTHSTRICIIFYSFIHVLSTDQPNECKRFADKTVRCLDVTRVKIERIEGGSLAKAEWASEISPARIV